MFPWREGTGLKEAALEQLVPARMVQEMPVCLRFGIAALVLQSSVLRGQDPLYWAMSQEFCSSQTVGYSHCGHLEMPTGGFGLGQGGGLFPGCDGQGFANSRWRHHSPARHSMPRGLQLRPQSCLIQ